MLSNVHLQSQCQTQWLLDKSVVGSLCLWSMQLLPEAVIWSVILTVVPKTPWGSRLLCSLPWLLFPPLPAACCCAAGCHQISSHIGPLVNGAVSGSQAMCQVPTWVMAGTKPSVKLLLGWWQAQEENEDTSTLLHRSVTLMWILYCIALLL